jgi:hypothetical protein
MGYGLVSTLWQPRISYGYTVWQPTTCGKLGMPRSRPFGVAAQFDAMMAATGQEFEFGVAISSA